MSEFALTGWDLRTGEGVYRTPTGGWSVWFDEAALFDKAAADALAADIGRTETEIVVNAYPIAVEAGRPAGRARLREAIRAAGPTVRLDLGKQADARTTPARAA
ncbi:MAG: DUF2849 domain-containing protein [Maricaulaceae bacterium]